MRPHSGTGLTNRSILSKESGQRGTGCQARELQRLTLLGLGAQHRVGTEGKRAGSDPKAAAALGAA